MSRWLSVDNEKFLVEGRAGELELPRPPLKLLSQPRGVVNLSCFTAAPQAPAPGGET